MYSFIVDRKRISSRNAAVLAGILKNEYYDVLVVITIAVVQWNLCCNNGLSFTKVFPVGPVF